MGVWNCNTNLREAARRSKRLRDGGKKIKRGCFVSDFVPYSSVTPIALFIQPPKFHGAVHLIARRFHSYRTGFRCFDSSDRALGGKDSIHLQLQCHVGGKRDRDVGKLENAPDPPASKNLPLTPGIAISQCLFSRALRKEPCQALTVGGRRLPGREAGRWSEG